jgi:tRNA pseudouridine38-40 synthase
MRYFIHLSYKGTKYHGWQIQPNAITVQEILQKALSVLLKSNTEIIGAGRTDTGVHASYFIAHFNTNDSIDCKAICLAMNRTIPFDIAIHSIFQVADDAHSRFSALSRTYNYYISLTKDPFALETSTYIWGNLDVDSMNKACDILFEYTDFTSFSKLHTDTFTNNCHIMEARWMIPENNKLLFTIKADRFLRNMVRAIVGTMLEIGRGKYTLDDFRSIIESKDRSKAGVSAPAQGLFLCAIEYPFEFLTTKELKG